MGVFSDRHGGGFSRSSSRRRQGPLVCRSLIEQLEPRWLLSAAPVADSTALVAGSMSGGAGSQAAEAAAAGKSIDAFALDLYAQLQGTTGGNLFVSPFSAATALAMAYAGAGGDTAQQMAKVLHFSGDPNSTESGFGALLGDLNATGQSGGFLLSAANALWVQQGLNLLPEFLNVMQNDFNGGLNQADFIDQADAVRQTINNWVAQQTHGKITDLFPPGTITDFTRLVLADAVYLKAAWTSPFEPGATTDAPFTLASGSQATVSTMHQTGEFGYMERDGFQVLQLPYTDGRLAMDIILPTQTGLAGLGSNQIPADINAWISGLSPQSVAISLPKFQMTTQFNLIPTLQALGMSEAFTDSAGFSGITDALRLKIDTVVQKAYISVDENGTEAAAATGIGVVPAVVAAEPNPPVIFNADHPFLFLIRDTQSGTVLFMGQVEDPAQQGSDPSAPVITQQPRSEEPVTQNPAPQNPITPVPVQQPIVVTPPIEIVGPVAPPPQQPIVVTPPIEVVGPVAPPPQLVSAPVAPGPTLSPNEKVVSAMYEALLHRTAEPAALAYWSNLLDDGASPAKVAVGIEASSEYRQEEVESLYQHYLGRAADANGLAFFTAQLAAGGTIEQIAATLAGSAEFAQSHGGGGNLVEALFTAILDRPVDARSLALFEQQQAAGASGSQLASQMLASDEYQRQVASKWLTQFLDRPADSSGVSYFAALLHAGATDEEIAGDVLASDEFLAKAT
ncbi:MAG TPA: serpin family protein [Pirellulales bacterium]